MKIGLPATSAKVCSRKAAGNLSILRSGGKRRGCPGSSAAEEGRWSVRDSRWKTERVDVSLIHSLSIPGHYTRIALYVMQLLTKSTKPDLGVVSYSFNRLNLPCRLLFSSSWLRRESRPVILVTSSTLNSVLCIGTTAWTGCDRVRKTVRMRCPGFPRSPSHSSGKTGDETLLYSVVGVHSLISQSNTDQLAIGHSPDLLRVQCSLV